MELRKLWFENGRIFIETTDGKVLSQSLKMYPILRKATDEQKQKYRLSPMGIHWDEIDEDISFESFFYEETEGVNNIAATLKQFPEINISKLAQRMGIPQSVFASYLCGAKKPSDNRKAEIEQTLHELGKELLMVKL